jgi:photosynthetic reaction center H subunit
VTRDKSDDRDEAVTLGHTRDMRSTSAGTLMHLGDLDDVKVAEGAPDVRGWDVTGSDGESLGKVSDLVVDTGAMKVRYLEVTLDKDVAKESGRTDAPVNAGARTRDDDDLEPFRHVLVPIGAARLDEDEKEVRLDAAARQVAGIPEYRRGSLTRDYERGLVGSFTSSPADRGMSDRTIDRGASGAQSDDFYSSAHFDDRAFFGRRGTPDDRNSYLTTHTGLSRGSSQTTGGGPLASDDVQRQLDPRPGSVGDSRI